MSGVFRSASGVLTKEIREPSESGWNTNVVVPGGVKLCMKSCCSGSLWEDTKQAFWHKRFMCPRHKSREGEETEGSYSQRIRLFPNWSSSCNMLGMTAKACLLSVLLIVGAMKSIISLLIALCQGGTCVLHPGGETNILSHTHP